MIEIFAIIKGVVEMTAIAAVSTGVGMVADIVGNDTPITLGGAIGVGAVVVLGAWYLSGRLQKIDDRLKSIELNCNFRCNVKPENQTKN